MNGEWDRTPSRCLCFVSSNYRNVPGECPVMCGTCKSDGSAGSYFIPALATNLIAGSSRHLIIYNYDSN